MSKKLMLTAIVALGLGVLANGLTAGSVLANSGGTPNDNATDGNTNSHGDNPAGKNLNAPKPDPQPGRGNDRN